MEISVKKLTDLDLLHRANEFTTGHESKMSLKRAYFYGHSPIRTQIFWVEMKDIPLFVASQLVRQHVGVQFFQRSKRIDRGGEDFIKECDEMGRCIGTLQNELCATDNDKTPFQLAMELDKVLGVVGSWPNRFDRYAPTDLACIINAEALINMAHKRLCSKASKETRELVEILRSKIAEVDPALAQMMVRPCVANGLICREPKSCGFNNTELCFAAVGLYKSLKQQ